MLRCIPRSIIHVGAPSRLQCRLGTSSNFSVDTAIAARGKPAIGPCLPSFCTRGAQRLSSPTTGSMRPMSSAVISARRGGRNDKPSTFKGKIGAESIVAPTGELPANLKLAVDVQVSLDEERERHEEQKEGEEAWDDSSVSLPVEEPGSFTGTEVEVLSWSEGTKVGTRSLDPEVFGMPVRRDVVHDVIRWQLAKRRSGNAKTKRIGEIRGSGRKVRPQKGQGTARAGHSRPPHWRGGAKAHGPRIRDWSYKLNKKFVKLGLRVALSARLREGKLKVVDGLTSDKFSTASMLNTMEARGVKSSVLFIDQDIPAKAFVKSTTNIIGVKVLPAKGANVYDVIKRSDLVITEAGISHLESVLKPL